MKIVTSLNLQVLILWNIKMCHDSGIYFQCWFLSLYALVICQLTDTVKSADTDF
jgi:hypothetical protein